MSRAGGPTVVVRDLPELRDQVGVFRDRAHAGRVLARLLEGTRGSQALVLAIPAGGVPVAVALAEELGLSVDLAVVSKITLPWNTEAGYGAVAFDGGVFLDETRLPGLGLAEEEVREGIASTRRKVERRVRLFRGERPLPDLASRTALLVDDGLASGATLRAGLGALRRAGAGQILIAVPTGHPLSAERLAREADAVFCANLRGGAGFAVADAYREWRDISEAEALATLLESKPKPGN